MRSPTTTAPPELTPDQQEWCSFDTRSPEDALRFDDIFEAGRQEGLPMSNVNAFASARRSELETQGVTPDEAVRIVSEELLDNLDFRLACIAAYEFWVGE